jgi:polysaccharide biosynthesis transport protein
MLPDLGTASPRVVVPDRHQPFQSGARSMPDVPPDLQQTRGLPPGNGRPLHLRGPLADGITPAEVRRAIQGNFELFLFAAGLTVAVSALMVFGSPPDYSARAAIRMASERRTLTSGVEDAPQTLDRPVDPLLSAVQVLSSRTLVGSVVDSLGLRLRPVKRLGISTPLFGRRLPPGALQRIAIDSGAAPDTLVLQFTKTDVVAWSRTGKVSARVGRPLRIGGTQLTVPAAPPVDLAILAIEPRDVTIDGALRKLKVVPRPGTDVIDVKYVDADPALAQRFANNLAWLFQAANGHSAQEQARRRREFLSDQLQVTDSLLVDAERELSQFRSGQQMGSSRDNLTAEQATAATLEARSVELRADRRVFASLLDRLKGSTPGEQDAGFRALAYSPEVAGDPILGHLQERLLDYHSRLDSLTTGPWRSLPTHPDVVQLTTLVQTTRDELVRAVAARVASLDARLAVLSNQIAAGGQSMRSLPAKQATESSLDRRVEVLRTTADALRQEYQKARISEALGAADIEILDLAPLPYRKTGIPRSIELALGLMLGLMLGGGTAVLAEVTNRSVRRPDELYGMIGAAELGIIPRIPRIQRLGSNGGRPLLANGSNGAKPRQSVPELVFDGSGSLRLEAEAFRTLRMGLAFSWGDRPCTLVVTSAAPQEGKTLIATNLAATFARGGAKVLLVDCDIHRPRLHRLFKISRAPGLMDLLRMSGLPGRPIGSAAALDQRLGAVRPTSVERLSLLPCGADPQSSPELLEPATLRGLLDGLRKDFDVIVLDTPPVLVSADAATLAASADGVILVVRAGQTDRGAAELARHRVTAAGGQILGAVLNDPDGIMDRFGSTTYTYDYPALVD